jgi:hypothetical protein
VRQCAAEGYDSFRLAIVTRDGATTTVIAKGGCHVENPECGERRARDFGVVGGGLERGVLEAAEAKFASLPAEEPLACRLFKTLKAIYAAGGEHKSFRGASVTVDDPSLSKLLHWEARGKEKDLLEGLRKGMSKGGMVCP